jgi:hypothetical protein
MWVFLDDNGANNDDDHDDYVVRISVSDNPRIVLTPEPGSFVLPVQRIAWPRPDMAQV